MNYREIYKLVAIFILGIIVGAVIVVDVPEEDQIEIISE